MKTEGQKLKIAFLYIKTLYKDYSMYLTMYHSQVYMCITCIHVHFSFYLQSLAVMENMTVDFILSLKIFVM